MPDGSEERILNIDNTHLRGCSMPREYGKESRECKLPEHCEDKVSTNETADWHIQGKDRPDYARQIRVSQLADSVASVSAVEIRGIQEGLRRQDVFPGT